jgi:hypothetical protein
MGAQWFVTLTGPRLVNDKRAASVVSDASDGTKTIVGNLTAQDTWRPRECRTRCAASIASTIDTSGDPDQCITALFEGVPLYICVGRLYGYSLGTLTYL